MWSTPVPHNQRKTSLTNGADAGPSVRPEYAGQGKTQDETVKEDGGDKLVCISEGDRVKPACTLVGDPRLANAFDPLARYIKGADDPAGK